MVSMYSVIGVLRSVPAVMLQDGHDHLAHSCPLRGPATLPALIPYTNGHAPNRHRKTVRRRFFTLRPMRSLEAEEPPSPKLGTAKLSDARDTQKATTTRTSSVPSRLHSSTSGQRQCHSKRLIESPQARGSEARNVVGQHRLRQADQGIAVN